MPEVRDVPYHVHEEHMAVCRRCWMRRYAETGFDMHFDWLDCMYDCENDYRHWAASQEAV